MAVRWLTLILLLASFGLGAVATVNPALSVAAIALCALALISASRVRKTHWAHTATNLPPDWIVVLLPTAVALRIISNVGSLIVLAILVAIVFIRRTDTKYKIHPGPLLLLLVAAAIVVVRPSSISAFLTFVLVCTIVLRLVSTVDARRLVASLIDGLGLYLLANVVLYAVGLQSLSGEFRIGGLAESTGFVRIIYPLAASINIPPVVAAIYGSAVIFLLVEPDRARRVLRFLCLLAGVIVLITAGTRAPLAVAVVLTTAVLCFPFITRWIAQAATLLTAVSAFVLPSIVLSLQSAITPLMSLSPGRVNSAQSITSLEGRDYVWSRSIEYWGQWVNDLPHMLFGFGANGHYRSGASLTYSDRFVAIIRDPEASAFMHNSFLQQLFDGGIVGWLLLAGAVYWASERLARHRRDWGYLGSSTIVAMAALILSGMTEVYYAPGVGADLFVVLLIFVAAGCQASVRQADDQADPQTTDSSPAPHLRPISPDGGTRRAVSG